MADESTHAPRAGEHAWNPGLRSTLPAELEPLVTLFRDEHVFTSHAEVLELASLTGLSRESLPVFRPRRLITHEVLVRVTADLAVSDGNEYEDLGNNVRAVVARIIDTGIEPHMARIESAWSQLRDTVHATVLEEFHALLAGPAADPVAPRRWWQRSAPAPARSSFDEHLQATLARWRARAEGSVAVLRTAVHGVVGEQVNEHATFAALLRVCEAVRARSGRLPQDADLLARVATGMAMNRLGAEQVAHAVGPLFERAVRDLGLRRLPQQAAPVVMNVKGASAAGKSTLRPLQRELAKRIGAHWEDFALISPDIWRKFLLDYESLGPAYKYAGTFSSHELRIVDQKLDRYMADKGRRGDVPHLLIDRFRFDSFAPASDVKGSNLLTRFGSVIYMFFMITPPEATVERAWLRGLAVGRYKAVDDLLHHNIEAFTGMPELFFTWVEGAWAEGRERDVHYEFLDNGVPKGALPRSVAFGWGGEMNVLDISKLLDVNRYARVDVDAKTPAGVYPEAAALAPSRNVDFLDRCVRTMPVINFADPDTGAVYLRCEAGNVHGVHADGLAAACADEDTRAALEAVLPGAFEAEAPRMEEPVWVPEARTAAMRDTLGAWGEAPEMRPREGAEGGEDGWTRRS